MGVLQVCRRTGDYTICFTPSEDLASSLGRICHATHWNRSTALNLTPIAGRGPPPHTRQNPEATDWPLNVHAIFNFLSPLLSIIYRPKNRSLASLNAIRRTGESSCAYPTQPPRPIRLRRPPRHRRARRPLPCRRRTRLHLRPRPIRRPSHLPHSLPRLPSVGLRPMLLPLRHRPHHPRLQRHPPSPGSAGRPRSRALQCRRPLPRRLPRHLLHSRQNPPRSRQPRRPVRRNYPRGLDRRFPGTGLLRNFPLHPLPPRPRTAQPPDIRFTPRDPPLHPQPRRPKFPRLAPLPRLAPRRPPHTRPLAECLRSFSARPALSPMPPPSA